MVNKSVDFTFKCMTYTDYELEIIMHAENHLVLKVFQKARYALARRKNINVSGQEINKIEEFEIPQKYVNTIKTIAQPILRNIRKQLKRPPHNCTLMDERIEKCNFIRDKSGTDWDIKINFEGVYVKKA